MDWLIDRYGTWFRHSLVNLYNNELFFARCRSRHGQQEIMSAVLAVTAEYPSEGR